MAQLRQIPSEELFTSTVCIMELSYGCALRQDPGLWKQLQEGILDLLTFLPLGPQEAVRSGELLAELSQKGTPIGVEDTQIGATALVHGLTVVTFNTKHFQLIKGLAVENWLV